MSKKVSRRDFLKLASLGAGTTAILTGCGPASRYVQREPYMKMPEYTYGCLSSIWAMRITFFHLAQISSKAGFHPSLTLFKYLVEFRHVKYQSAWMPLKPVSWQQWLSIHVGRKA